jgi:hypothetical protein
MPKRPFKVGDKVTVVGAPRIRFPPGMRDELGTKRLFKSMVGRVYTVRGFDKQGQIELRPKRLDLVWVEPELLKLRARKRKRPQP